MVTAEAGAAASRLAKRRWRRVFMASKRIGKGERKGDGPGGSHNVFAEVGIRLVVEVVREVGDGERSLEGLPLIRDLGIGDVVGAVK